MTTSEALAKLREMGDDLIVRRMSKFVEQMGRVPLWIENEIKFHKVATPRLEGDTAGLAAAGEDARYHGGYVE